MFGFNKGIHLEPIPLIQQSLKGTLVREDETHIGQVIPKLDYRKFKTKDEFFTALHQFKRFSEIKFAIIGINEDIGPRANGGLAGCGVGWESFCDAFFNIQVNAYLNVDELMVVGCIDCSDLQDKAYGLRTDDPKELKQLRAIVSELDQRVIPIIETIIKVGLIPIVVGGGHNNIYPILKAMVQMNQYKPVSVINCDLHSDCRPLEGRHSGNGFSYAIQEGLVDRYLLMGFHSAYNSQKTIDFLKEHQVDFEALQWMALIQSENQFQLIQNAVDALFTDKNAIIPPACMTICCDSFDGIPASARTQMGISVPAVLHLMKIIMSYQSIDAFFIAEAAPTPKNKIEMTLTGKFQSQMVLSFLSAKNTPKKEEWVDPAVLINLEK